jgi:hypothetical protein
MHYGIKVFDISVLRPEDSTKKIQAWISSVPGFQLLQMAQSSASHGRATAGLSVLTSLTIAYTSDSPISAE